MFENTPFLCLLPLKVVPLEHNNNIIMYKAGKHKLLDSIIEGIQDKKGHNISIVDLSGIDDTICTYFVIAQGGSPTQVHALAMSVGDKARELCGARPLAVDGLRNSNWVAMDYADIIVHIFLPEERAFYDIEHLWADAEITEIPDWD